MNISKKAKRLIDNYIYYLTEALEFNFDDAGLNKNAKRTYKKLIEYIAELEQTETT